MEVFNFYLCGFYVKLTLNFVALFPKSLDLLFNIFKVFNSGKGCFMAFIFRYKWFIFFINSDRRGTYHSLIVCWWNVKQVLMLHNSVSDRSLHAILSLLYNHLIRRKIFTVARRTNIIIFKVLGTLLFQNVLPSHFAIKFFNITITTVTKFYPF